jgi:hypothetical protein
MKSPFVILIFVVLSLMIASPALAQSEDACPHHDMMATVQALIKCVQHASDQSFITEPDITDSLLDKLYSAISFTLLSTKFKLKLGSTSCRRCMPIIWSNTHSVLSLPWTGNEGMKQ